MEKEEKFFFNHYSLTSDDATNLLSTMIEGIKVFYLKKRLENTTFYFYTEMDSFWDFKVDTHLTMRDVFFSLEDAYKSFFIQFIEKSVKIENIFENEEILNQLPNYDIVIKGDGSGEQYYLFVLNTDLNGVLLSFNQGTWVESLVEVCKVEDNNYIDIKLKNIAKKEHAIELLSFENEALKEKVLGNLSHENIKYTDAFITWLNLRDISHLEHIVEKINFAMEHKLERRAGAIGKINSKEINNLFEVVVGSPQGMEDAQIRVFFKDFDGVTYFLYGFIKRNEYGISYEKLGHISNTLKIIKDEKLDEI